MGISDFFYDKMLKMLDAVDSSRFTGEPVERGDAPFTFVVFGDPQVSNYMFARENSFYKGCRDLARSAVIDALVLVGDITENGMKCEFRTVARMLNEISGVVNNFFLIPGNHDVRFRPFHRQLNRFRKFAESVVNGHVPAKGGYYHSHDFPLCRFIMMGTDRSTFEAAYISPAQLDWLDREIGIAESEKKPAFVFNHQTLKGANGLPYTWMGKGKWRGSIGMESNAVKSVFEKHNNVIFVTGHLHFGTSKYNYEDYGSYKCLSVPTVGAGNHGECSYDTQGYVINVYEDKIIAKARRFGDGEYIDSGVENAEIQINLDK
ncbi:MAG: metallophosphoesterase [Clostridia bacterium]|nr:metallophosphoesterase [Clostridia bacterium]